MSLIHEALKKVERQRQLGAAPTLGTPRLQRRRRRWPWLFLLVLVFLVAGTWIWRGPLVHKARSVASHFVTSNEAGAGAETITQARPGDHVPVPEMSAKAVAPEQTKPDANNPVKPTPPSASKTAARMPAVQPEREAQTSPNKVRLAPAAQSELTAATKPAEKPAAVGQQTKQEPPMYWELPYAQRRDIPELSISMHMYTEAPADRFVIINGERQVEGDTLLSGLKLIAISPDSITLDKDGQHFRVPRQGSH